MPLFNRKSRAAASILEFVGSAFRPSPQQLIRKATSVGQRVQPGRKAIKALKVARRYGLGIDGHQRWDAWRELLDVHKDAVAQLKILASVRRLLSQADRAELDGELLGAFLAPFGSSVRKPQSLSQVETEARRLERLWQEVLEQGEAVKPRVFVVHAFLRLAQLSGVEIASLFLAGLVGLGALYTLTFYRAAVGADMDQSIAAYFTVDDLINQGIQVLLQIAVALAIIEVSFLLIRATISLWQWNPYRAHWWVLKRSGSMVVVVVFVIGLFTVVWGHGEGRQKRERFERMTREEAQLATVMDGTILDDVFLVGTTSRTATFLQVREWGTLGDSAMGTASRRCERRPLDGGLARRDCVLGSRVLVMDRALVVCHSLGNACEDQRKSMTWGAPVGGGQGESLPPSTGLWGIEAQLGGLGTQVGKLEGSLVEGFRGVDSHLNRHLGQIRRRIDRLGRELGESMDSALARRELVPEVGDP